MSYLADSSFGRPTAHEINAPIATMHSSLGLKRIFEVSLRGVMCLVLGRIPGGTLGCHNGWSHRSINNLLEEAFFNENMLKATFDGIIWLKIYILMRIMRYIFGTIIRIGLPKSCSLSALICATVLITGLVWRWRQSHSFSLCMAELSLVFCLNQYAKG